MAYLKRSDVKPQFGKQTDLMRMIAKQEVDFALIGGSRFGGKTELLSMMPLLFANDPHFRAIFFRRSYEEIMGGGGLWQKAQNQYKLFDAKPNKTDKTWTFPHRDGGKDGATVQYSHMYNDGDEESHRGKGYSMVGFDEINQFTEEQVQMLATCLRSEADMNSFMVGTLNPDPDSWCMKLVEWYLDKKTGYPDANKSGQIRWYVIKNDEFIFGESEEWFKEHHMDALTVTPPPQMDAQGNIIREFEPIYTPPKRFTFIFFTIFDNAIGMTLNPQYLTELNNLPDHKRETQLYGNWFAREKAHNSFRREWLKHADCVPLGAVGVRAWDKAYGENVKAAPDFSASINMFRDKIGNTYICGNFHENHIDVFDPMEDIIYGRFRQLAGKRNEWMLEQAQEDGAEITMVIPEESGAGKAEFEDMSRMFTNAGFKVIGAKTGNAKNGKFLRFASFASAAQLGNVYIVPSTFPNQATLNIYLKELEEFTGEGSTRKKKDDWVDCTSDGFNALARVRQYEVVAVPDVTAGSSSKTLLSQHLARVRR